MSFRKMLYIYYNKSEYIHLSFIQYIIYKFHFIYLSSNKYIQGLSFIHSLECVHQCTRYHEDVKKITMAQQQNVWV